MTLAQWLEKHNKTQTWLAQKMKSDQGYVSRLVAGKTTPKMPTMSKVHNITNGAVSYPDWAAQARRTK